MGGGGVGGGGLGGGGLDGGALGGGEVGGGALGGGEGGGEVGGGGEDGGVEGGKGGSEGGGDRTTEYTRSSPRLRTRPEPGRTTVTYSPINGAPNELAQVTANGPASAGTVIDVPVAPHCVDVAEPVSPADAPTHT